MLHLEKRSVWFRCGLGAVLAILIVSAAPAWAAKKPGTGRHGGLTWKGPGTCLQCHLSEANDVVRSAHYKWEGPTPYLTSGPATQGKLKTALNSYCVNILGNWNACGACHIGQGARPDATAIDHARNVDCLVCHQERYKRKRDTATGQFVPDPAAMTITMDQAVQTVHRPTRATCLQCHGRSGGGDNYKRGDLAMAHAATTDRNFDVHMATTGANLPCQRCHVTDDHRIAGRGSDLRETDLDVAMNCSDSRCHTGKATGGHATAGINAHVARVACQTCHVKQYARNAADSAATEKTETHRTWLVAAAPNASGVIHPSGQFFNDLRPAYRFWNKTSEGYSLGEVAVLDPATGRYPTSRPLGSIDDPTTASKLYPFKYKTADQPATADNKLVAIDTSVYFRTGDYAAATLQGVANMQAAGYAVASTGLKAVRTDTFQLITHEVGPRGMAAQCAECHGPSATQMNLRSLGYTLKAAPSGVCTQCHEPEDDTLDFYAVHRKHVADKKIDCSMCHAFRRPERGLTVGIVRGDD